MAPRSLYIVEHGPQQTSLMTHQGEGSRDAERRDIEAACGVVISEDGHISKRSAGESVRINPWLAYGDAIADAAYGKRN